MAAFRDLQPVPSFGTTDPLISPRAAQDGGGMLAAAHPSLGIRTPALEASAKLWKQCASKLGVSAPSRAKGKEKALPKVAPPAPKILSWKQAVEGPGLSWVCGERLKQGQGCWGP